MELIFSFVQRMPISEEHLLFQSDVNVISNIGKREVLENATKADALIFKSTRYQIRFSNAVLPYTAVLCCTDIHPTVY